MKTKVLAPILLALMSCSSETYFQLYNTNAENAVKTGNSIVFEDQRCRVIYNLWSDGGDVGFIFVNKGAEEITINMDKSHFVFNGSANDYFQHRIFTRSTNSSSASSNS